MANKYKLLSDEMVAELKQRQRELHDALELLNKVEDCNIDCQDLRKAHGKASEQIEKLLANFA